MFEAIKGDVAARRRGGRSNGCRCEQLTAKWGSEAHPPLYGAQAPGSVPCLPGQTGGTGAWGAALSVSRGS